MSNLAKERDQEINSFGINGPQDDNYINFVETQSMMKNKNKLNLKTRAKLHLTSTFKEHAKVVDRINELNLGWKAFNYDQFSDLTIEQLNKMSGRNKSGTRNKIAEDSILNNSGSFKHKKVKKFKKSKKTQRVFNQINLVSKPQLPVYI